MTLPPLHDQLRDVRVDRTRLLAGITELGRIGAVPGSGVTRLGFTPAEDEARAYLVERCRHSSLAPHVDEAGNVVISRPGARPGVPALLMGSHMDTVIKGGRLDGAYGVMAALEVLLVLAERDEPLGLEPVVIAFANEEAGLFPYPSSGRAVSLGRWTRTLLTPAAMVPTFGPPWRGPEATCPGSAWLLGRAARSVPTSSSTSSRARIWSAPSRRLVW